jgi:hypothetical protein
MSLKEFLLCEDPRVRMVTENFQAKALAYDIRYEHQGAIADLRGEAKRHLTKFDFVGIVEYFEESVKALSRAIGMELAVKKLNVNGARSAGPSVSAEEIKIIQGLNAVDIAIYTKALAKFERLYLGQ